MMVKSPANDPKDFLLQRLFAVWNLVAGKGKKNFKKYRRQREGVVRQPVDWTMPSITEISTRPALEFTLYSTSFSSSPPSRVFTTVTATQKIFFQP